MVLDKEVAMVLPNQKSVKIAYIIKCFPRLSETFILHEILELERLGLSLQIYSLLEPSGEINQAAQGVQSPVIYLPQKTIRGLVTLIGGAARRFFKNPFMFIAVSTTALIRFHRPFSILNIFYAACLADRLEHAGVTHIHAHYANKPATVALLAHKLTGIPFSFTAHAKDIYLSYKPSLAYKMRQAHTVITCTEYNQQYLASLLRPRDHVTIQRIYHGLDLRIFPANPSKTRAARPLILTVARLVEKKGLPYLLQACRLLKDRGYDFTCRVVGEGPLRPQLEKQIHDLDLNNCVELFGAVPHEHVIEMYRQATLMVLPSIVAENGDRDGIPNVLAEAMYMHVPVVSTPVSGIPELLTSGENGLLVAERDSAALAEAMARLLDNEGLRTRLAQAGHLTVIERFNMAVNAQKLATLFLNQQSDSPERTLKIEETPGNRIPFIPERILPTENDNQIATFLNHPGNNQSLYLDEELQRKVR
jgi:glycosyltransferase involved in cell wall biosynthesis